MARSSSKFRLSRPKQFLSCDSLTFQIVVDLPSEVWRTVSHYPAYRVSTFGRVKRVDSNGEKLLNVENARGDYPRAAIDPKTTVYVHRLMGAAFIEGWKPSFQVDHIDGVRSNNNLANLRLVTPAENIRNAIRNRKHATVTRKRPVIARKGGIELRFKSMNEANRTIGLYQGAVYRVIAGFAEEVQGWTFAECTEDAA